MLKNILFILLSLPIICYSQFRDVNSSDYNLMIDLGICANDEDSTEIDNELPKCNSCFKICKFSKDYYVVVARNHNWCGSGGCTAWLCEKVGDKFIYLDDMWSHFNIDKSTSQYIRESKHDFNGPCYWEVIRKVIVREKEFFVDEILEYKDTINDKEGHKDGCRYEKYDPKYIYDFHGNLEEWILEINI